MEKLARMQKAIAIVQFKLEGQLFRKHPEWQLEHRALLHRIDPKAGTIEIDGKTYPLLDTRLPTIDWNDPYALSAAEQQCMAKLTRSFVRSATLRKRQMQFVASRAQMWLVRDRCVIFHGCVPVDSAGNFLPFPIDGRPERGKALFRAIERVIQRAARKRAEDARKHPTSCSICGPGRSRRASARIEWRHSRTYFPRRQVDITKSTRAVLHAPSTIL